MRRQGAVEPQQIRMFPNVADDVIGDHGFDAAGEIAGQPNQPVGIRREQGAVDGDSELFPLQDVLDSPQAVLPATLDGCHIERRHIKLNARGCEIDSHPVDDAPPLPCRAQPPATIGDALKDV